MSINNFNNFNNVSSKQNDNENEDSLKVNSEQFSNIGQNINGKSENNDNNLDENKNTEDNTNYNTIYPVNNVDNTKNSINNNNNNSILLGLNDDIMSEFEGFNNSNGYLSFNPYSPINRKIINKTSPFWRFKEDFYDPSLNFPLLSIKDDDHKIKDMSQDDSSFHYPDSSSFLHNKIYSKSPYSINNDSLEDKKNDYTSSNKNSKSSEENNKGNTFLSKKRKKGRLSKKSKEKNDGIKRHTNKEIGNVTRKMLTSLKKKAHKFIKFFTRFKFYEPNIKKFITGSHRKIRRLLKLKLVKLYFSHTLPKNFEGVKRLKNIKNLKLKRKKKIKLLRNYKISISNKILDEEAQEIRPVTAILDLTLLDFLKIYLDYGYNENNNRTIEIDENIYGLKFINLTEFKTYYETKNEFSLDLSEQNYYREHLKRIINRKERLFQNSLRYKPVQKDTKKKR